jgi:hypothetical protein
MRVCLSERTQPLLVLLISAHGKVIFESGGELVPATISRSLSEMVLQEVDLGFCERIIRVEDAISPTTNSPSTSVVWKVDDYR